MRNILSIILGFCLTLAGFYYGKSVGQDEGLDMYHNQCFDVGGYVINNVGKVVKCGPINIIPEEERKLYNITSDKT